jgi:hypothetical protein
MLHEAGASYAAIARGAGLSRSRVQQVCQSYAYHLHRRTEYVTGGERLRGRLRRQRRMRRGALGGVRREHRLDLQLVRELDIGDPALGRVVEQPLKRDVGVPAAGSGRRSPPRAVIGAP